MEVIKKTILQAVTTGTTSGGIVIKPDLTKVYFFKVLLTQEAHDYGFFDAYVEGSEPIPTESTYYTDYNDDMFVDYNDDKFIT